MGSRLKIQIQVSLDQKAFSGLGLQLMASCKTQSASILNTLKLVRMPIILG